MTVIRDASLASQGARKIAWARRYMPLLEQLEKEFRVRRPFVAPDGTPVRVSLSIHLEAKTAVLAQTLSAGGAALSVTGSNPLSTQDDVAAALAAGDEAHPGLSVFAWHGASDEEYTTHLEAALEHSGRGPQIVIDDGGDLVQLLHETRVDLSGDVWGGCEETTTGLVRLRARAAAGALHFPMIAVNDAQCKHLFDNRYGTGQSVWDAVCRTTNLIVAGKTVVVAGYGWCGRGVATKARGLGARVIVTEVDPVKALEAHMDGYTVLPMLEAAPLGDVFLTLTGDRDVLRREHFERMKDGALLANAGHFDVEISKPDLRALAREVVTLKPNIEGYVLPDGRTLCLLAEGRLVNLGAGDGHPVEIMDMSFAIQALAAEYLVAHHEALAPAVHDIPAGIDGWVAERKLRALGLAIDRLSPEQERYLQSWAM